MQMLSLTNTTVLGVVLNRVRRRSQSVSTYYSYGARPRTRWEMIKDGPLKRDRRPKQPTVKARPVKEPSPESDGNHKPVDSESLDSEALDSKGYTRAKKFQ
jgi:hypothetical protein